MNAISIALTLWQNGFASEDDVIDWAYSEIIKSDVPAQELIDLALNGPLACVRQASHVFPSKPVELGYQDEFVLRTAQCDFKSDKDVFQFVDWASKRCMGEDLSNELVKWGYQFDHLICDCNDMPAAILWAREKIPLMEAHFTKDVSHMLEQVPTLRLIAHGKNLATTSSDPQ